MCVCDKRIHYNKDPSDSAVTKFKDLSDCAVTKFKVNVPALLGHLPPIYAALALMASSQWVYSSPVFNPGFCGPGEMEELEHTQCVIQRKALNRL